MSRQQCWSVEKETGEGRIGPKSASRQMAEQAADDQAAARLASALEICARALRNLDVERIRDPRARAWVRTIERAVERGTTPEGRSRLSAREQAALDDALDRFTCWLQAEPRRLVWG